MEKILFPSSIKFLHLSSTPMTSSYCSQRRTAETETVTKLLDYEGAEPTNRFTVVGGFNVFILEH